MHFAKGMNDYESKESILNYFQSLNAVCKRIESIDDNGELCKKIPPKSATDETKPALDVHVGSVLSGSLQQVCDDLKAFYMKKGVVVVKKSKSDSLERNTDPFDSSLITQRLLGF